MMGELEELFYIGYSEKFNNICKEDGRVDKHCACLLLQPPQNNNKTIEQPLLKIT